MYLCGLLFEVEFVPVVAFDGVFADVDEFADEQVGQDVAEVPCKGGLPDETTDRGGAFLAIGVAFEVLPGGLVSCAGDVFGLLEKLVTVVFAEGGVSVAIVTFEGQIAFEQSLQEGA